MKVRVAADTSVLVAAFLSWHESHGPAAEALGAALAASALILPAPVLVETFAVLTRLPAPHRLAPEAALDLLRTNLGHLPQSPAPSGRRLWELLDRLTAAGIRGGAVYDAIVAASAVAGGATKLLTLNLREFERVSPEGLEVSGVGPT